MDPYRSPDELDLDNPYAPPRSSFQPEEAEKAESHGVSIPFTIDSIVTTAWEIFKARLGICLGLVWGAQLVNIGLALALLALNAGLTAAMPDERGLVMFIYWT